MILLKFAEFSESFRIEQNILLLPGFSYMASFINICSACQQHKIQYTEQRMNRYSYNFICNVTCTPVFVHMSCVIKSTDNNRKCLLNVKFTTYIGVPIFLTLLKI